jgi:hypothetical protein
MARDGAFLTGLAGRIAAHTLKSEPSQRELFRSKALSDVCVVERLLLKIKGLMSGCGVKLPEKRSPALRRLMSFEINSAALRHCRFHILRLSASFARSPANRCVMS